SQPRTDYALRRWLGQAAVVHTGPRSASSTSRHSISSRSAASPENTRVTKPAGGSDSANSTASRLSTASGSSREMFRHLTASTRSNRKAVRRRRKLGAASIAASQSNRLRPSTTRRSADRQTISPILSRSEEHTSELQSPYDL